MLEYSLGTVEEEEFKKSALSWIACNTKEVLESEAFLHHANDACVAAVLRLGELSVREVDIFEAVNF
jgi:hypothetical protein